jgi:hypothetical protein
VRDSLQLQTGLPIEGIPEKLAGLMSRWYEVYDAVCVAQDNVLRPEEIALSIMMNSRISGNTGYAVWCHREGIEEWLARIPPTADLAAADVPWEALQGVFDVFQHIPRAKVGVATEILHKKRPHLLPMLDTRVAGYYHGKLTGSAPTLGGYAVNLLKLFRGDLLAALPELRALCEEVERQGRPVSPVRMLDHLIWSQVSEQEKA